jgi:AcrR family transcriptional regulator
VTKGEDTRATVLAAALDMASQDGLAGVTIGRLAERVQMSKSGLFAHFASKENLEVAILQEAMDRFIAQVVSPALRERRGEPRVVALFRRWLAWADRPPGGCIFRVFITELDDKTGPARDLLVSSQRDWLDTISTAIRIAVDEGHFRPDLDPRQLAFEFYALGCGYHQLSRLFRDGEATARVHAAFERLLQSARP